MSVRRGNGEGSIYRRSDGRWAASLSIGRGRRKHFLSRTRQEVAIKLNAALKTRQDGLPILNERITLEPFLRDWLLGIRQSIRTTTWERYAALMRLHVSPTLGTIRLSQVTPAHLQRLFADLQQSGLSDATVRQVRAILRKALNDGTKWGVVARNVAALTSAPRVSRKEFKPLSPEESRAFLDAASGDKLEALYVLALTTGMRQGELLGLRWADVDFDREGVMVRQTLQRTSGGHSFGEPKSAKSRRRVALTKTAVDALRRHRVRQTEERLKVGPYWTDLDLVFTNHVGGPVNAGNLRRRSFWPLLDRACLPRIRFHDLRHTAATLMLGRGIHPKIVSEMLGHSQIAITLDLYSHVTETMQRDAARELDVLLRP